MTMKPFATFLVLGAGLAIIAGCGPKGEKPVPYLESRRLAHERELQQYSARQPAGSMSRSAATSPEIAQRLERRKNIVEELENVRDNPNMAAYRCQLVKALVNNGTVSQVPGEYDTVVIGHLADFARTLDDEPAAQAIAALMAIARINYDGTGHPQNRSVALAMAAMRDALKNPRISADTRLALNEFLETPDAIDPQPLLGNMPPCCETPQKLQESSEDQALELYRELVPDPAVRRQLYEQVKRMRR